uniref:Uncharacterized protein n=1 Tax=Zea mays TaxID=4577 RepID=B6UG68_MAIZE|nr:hypothetical protein [Zea mays]
MIPQSVQCAGSGTWNHQAIVLDSLKTKYLQSCIQ